MYSVVFSLCLSLRMLNFSPMERTIQVRTPRWIKLVVPAQSKEKPSHLVADENKIGQDINHSWQTRICWGDVGDEVTEQGFEVLPSENVFLQDSTIEIFTQMSSARRGLVSIIEVLGLD